MSEAIVIGSGPSGLAAAFRLQEAGHRVRILECAERPGSALISERHDGFLIDRGAFFIPTTHTAMLALADEAGIGADLLPGGDVFAVARGGQLHRVEGSHMARSFARTRLISRSAKVAAARLAADVVRARRARVGRTEQAGRYDTESLAGWARRTQHPEVAEYLVEAAVRSMYAAEADSLSRVEFLGVIALFGGAKLVAFAGGMAGYSRALSERFEITLGARVTAVERSGDRVEVTWTGVDGEHTEHVGGCVVALPARAAAAVLPQLDEWRRHYLQRIPRGRLLIVHAALGKRPALGATYSMIPRSEHPFIAGIVCDHNKAARRAPNGRGLLTFACTTEWSELHYDDDDESIAREVILGGQRFLPEVGDDVEFTLVSRWGQQYPPVGHYAGLGEFHARCERADPAIQLCGEYFSTPHIASATAAGELAARRLSLHLSSAIA